MNFMIISMEKLRLSFTKKIEKMGGNCSGDII